METRLPPCRFLYRSPPPAKVNSDIDNFFSVSSNVHWEKKKKQEKPKNKRVVMRRRMQWAIDWSH